MKSGLYSVRANTFFSNWFCFLGIVDQSIVIQLLESIIVGILLVLMKRLR